MNKLTKIVIGLVVTPLALIGAIATSPAAQAAGTVTFAMKTAQGTVNIRSGPGTSYSVTGTVAPGSSQTYDCYKTGTAVNGDTIWGHLANGKGYITDTYINEGGKTLNQFVGLCGAPAPTPTPTPAPAPSTCPTSTICLYYSAGETGSYLAMSGSNPDLHSFTFSATGNGKGQSVYYNVHSVFNRTSSSVTLYTGTWYTGSAQVISAGAKTDLNSLLVNKDASIWFGTGTPPKPPAPTFTAQGLLSEFTTYMTNHGNKYGSYSLGTNGCTTLAAWFVGVHTNLVYGNGDGQNVVQYMVNHNSGLKVTTTLTSAQLPALFSVAAWKAPSGYGASGTNSYGHTGIVLAINGSTATVLSTGSGLAGSANRAAISTATIPATGVTFVSLAGHTK